MESGYKVANCNLATKSSPASSHSLATRPRVRIKVVTMGSATVLSVIVGAIVISTSLFTISKVAAENQNYIDFAKTDTARLVATGDKNYAIFSTKLASKKLTSVSVNADDVILVSVDAKVSTSKLSKLSKDVKQLVEKLKDEILSGPGVKTYPLFVSGKLGRPRARSSVWFSSYASAHNDMSMDIKDEKNFSVAKPRQSFKWSRIFVDGDYVTLVFNNRRVEMKPIKTLKKNQIEYINELKDEVKHELSKRPGKSSKITGQEYPYDFNDEILSPYLDIEQLANLLLETKWPTDTKATSDQRVKTGQAPAAAPVSRVNHNSYKPSNKLYDLTHIAKIYGNYDPGQVVKKAPYDRFYGHWRPASYFDRRRISGYYGRYRQRSLSPEELSAIEDSGASHFDQDQAEESRQTESWDASE